jgi:hypothetical protein
MRYLFVARKAAGVARITPRMPIAAGAAGHTALGRQLEKN